MLPGHAPGLYPAALDLGTKLIYLHTKLAWSQKCTDKFLDFMYAVEMAYVEHQTMRSLRRAQSDAIYGRVPPLPPRAGYLRGYSPGGGEHDSWLTYVGRQRMHMQAPATRQLMWQLLGRRVVPDDFLSGPADVSREHELLGEPWVEID